MSRVITPTIGRVVWFRPLGDGGPTHAAIVTKVWDDRLVNLVVFGTTGDTFGQTSVAFKQPGDEVLPHSEYCEWMPYQIGQAERTQRAEAAGKTTETPR